MTVSQLQNWLKLAIIMCAAGMFSMMFPLESMGHDHGEIKETKVSEETLASAETASPEVCVQTLHDTLLKAMKLGKDAPCSKRYQLLEPFIEKLFDFSLTSRLVLGKYWKELSPEKRSEFVTAFRHMSTAIYAQRFQNYSGEQFRISETIRQKKNRCTVRTFIITSEGKSIPLDYTCVRHGNQWRIVTVTAQGVNDLAMKKSEYTNFLKDHSIDELIGFIEEQALKCTSETQSVKK